MTRLEKKILLGKHLLFVTAHPDDEAFLAAGTINLNHRAGGRNDLICATYGEKGKSHVGRVTQAQLKQIRRRELKSVSRFLKVDNLFALRLPDGNLANRKADLAARIAKLVKKLRPDVVVSFGPDGISGHLDHIAAGEVSEQIAREFCIPFVVFAPSPRFVKNFEKVKRRRKFGVYAENTVHGAHGFRLKVDPKVKAIVFEFHKSQNPFNNLPKSVVNDHLNYEYFREVK